MITKRILSCLILVLLLSNVLELTSAIHSVRATGEETVGQCLRMNVEENVTVSTNGTVQSKILMDVRPGPLADMYRKMLGAPPDASVEEEMPIPANRSEEVNSDENATGVVVAIRDEFLKPLMKEQLLSFGLETEVVDSKMVPRGNENECRVSIGGRASFEVFNLTQDGSNDIWEVSVGPFNTTAITGLVFSRLMFTQMMLRSLEGEQKYENHWQMRIVLPLDFTLLNGNEFIGKNWTIAFGGGTYLAASVRIDETSAIVVDEETVATEANITATPEDVHNSLSRYKVFEIKYSLPTSPSEHPRNKTAEEVNTNWNFETPLIRLPEISLSKTFEDKTKGYSLTLKLTTASNFSITEDMGWQFHWLWGWPPFQIDSFHTNTTLDFSTKIRFEINATYENTWEWPIFSKSLATFYFYCGVPAWIEFRLGSDAVLNLTAKAQLVMETVVNGSISTGAKWENQKWSQINKTRFNADYSDFKWSTYINVTVIPSIRFRLEFLFFSVAGPFVEFEPYAKIDVAASFQENATVSLDLSLRFKINVGVKWENTIKSILRWLQAPDILVQDQRWSIYDALIDDAHWQWNWTLNETVPSDLTHDLSVADLTANSSETSMIYVGTIVDVDVTVSNNGDYNETSDVMLFRDSYLLWSFPNFNFTSGENEHLHFSWDTSGLVPSNYTLTAEVRNVTGETRQEDNVMNITVNLVAWNDITLIGANTSPNEVLVGQIVSITVDVKNLGGLTENATITVYHNDTALQTQSIIGFLPKTETVLVFLWNTSSLTPGQLWSVWANASAEHYDNNATNDFVSAGNLITLYHPQANFTHFPIPAIENQTTTFDAGDSASQNGAITSYRWDFGDGNTATTSSPVVTHVFGSIAYYNVTLTVEDSKGLNDTKQDVINVLRHDVTITDVTPNRTWVYQGNPVNISVAAVNQGNFTESITVRLYYNITANELIGTQNIVLNVSEAKTLIFMWDTTDAQYCHNYTITGVVEIAFDSNMTNNEQDSATRVKVRILGDFNGDGYVGVDDIFQVGKSFGAEPEHPRWNVDADLNQDGYVGVDDIFIIASHFGQEENP